MNRENKEDVVGQAIVGCKNRKGNTSKINVKGEKH